MSTITVTSLLDRRTFGTLRYAIDNASSGDTIVFSIDTSTIILEYGELIIKNNLTISGGGMVTIDGNYKSRIFIIENYNLIVTIDGLIIKNGRYIIHKFSNREIDGGGGIYNNGTLILTNSTVKENTFTSIKSPDSGGGGGISNIGTLTLINSIVKENNVTGEGDGGGGIYNVNGTLTLINSTVSGNNARKGGGIFNHGTMILKNSTVSKNNATIVYNSAPNNNDGGGIYNSDYAKMTMTYSTVDGNIANDNGGGIYNKRERVTLTLTNSTVSRNIANKGGGIYNDAIMTLTNFTISGNIAFESGGGIYNYYKLTLKNCIISNNSAIYGGGIANISSLPNTPNLLIGNNIIARNIIRTITIGPNTSSGPDIYSNVTIESTGGNIIGDGTGASGYAITDLVGTSSNPIDPMLNPLGNYGAPTETMTLRLGSPLLTVEVLSWIFETDGL